MKYYVAIKDSKGKLHFIDPPEKDHMYSLYNHFGQNIRTLLTKNYDFSKIRKEVFK